MPFLLIRNDIAKVKADAVVNTANTRLEEGPGASRAIYLAAGEEKLREACRKIGGCELGKAVITPGFQLPAKYIIHAVGPVWQGGGSGEEEILAGTYRAALRLAVEYKLETIAFPLLCAGNYGFPAGRALRVATRTFEDFLLEHEMTIYLVLYDRRSLDTGRKLFVSIQEYIDDHYVKEYEAAYRPAKSRNLEARRQRAFFEQARSSEPFGNGPFLEAFSPAQPAPGKRKLEDIMKHLGETFSQMLLRLIDERGLTDSQVYHRANVDRRHFSKIRNNPDYAPNKKTVLAFSIALELSLDETLDLLKTAGYSFSDSSKFDVIIRFFLENRMYDVFEINEVLFAYDQPLIGG